MSARTTDHASAPVSRRERQREQLIRDAKQAARELIAAEGIDGLTLSAVARRLGVSSPALYRYFSGKQGLVRAPYEDLTDELIRTVDEAARRQDPDDISGAVHDSASGWARDGLTSLLGGSLALAGLTAGHDLAVAGHQAEPELAGAVLIHLELPSHAVSP